VSLAAIELTPSVCTGIASAWSACCADVVPDSTPAKLFWTVVIVVAARMNSTTMIGISL
jgi:hypothetical protein